MGRVGFGKAAGCISLLALAPIIMGANSFRTNFDERVLASHNRERSELGLPPLRWNSELASGAKEWADHLVVSGRFEHSPDVAGPPVGENIWGGTPEKFAPERMVARWIAEKQHFKVGVFPANSSTGDVHDVSHYTQVIWRKTSEVGCASSRGPNEEILVCRYSTAGNHFGQTPF